METQLVNKLKANESELWTPYKGSISERQRLILQALMYEGTNGATWKELGKHLNLHHGQISGALNGLHQLGFVFMLRTKKDGCHLYVSHLCRDQFTDEQVHDTPPPNKGKQRRQLLDDLFSECLKIRTNGSNDYRTSTISDLLDQIIMHDGITESKNTATEPKPKSKAVVAHPVVPVKRKKFYTPRGRHASVVEREQTIMSKIREMQVAKMKDTTAENIAILTGFEISKVRSSLANLRDAGKIAYPWSNEPETQGMKLAYIIKWDENIDHFVAK